jgi:hypothetical protein
MARTCQKSLTILALNLSLARIRQRILLSQSIYICSYILDLTITQFFVFSSSYLS